MKQKRHIKLYEDFVRKDNEIKEEEKKEGGGEGGNVGEVDQRVT